MPARPPTPIADPARAVRGHRIGRSARSAYSHTTIRETIELLRDPIRLAFALFGTAFLMLVFGFGISTDVNNLTFAVLDHDQSHESRAYLEELRGSPYFAEKRPLTDYSDLEKRMQSGELDAAIEIPPGFGRDIEARTPGLGRRLGRWRHAISRADDPRLSAGHACALFERSRGQDLHRRRNRRPPDIEIRFKYNQDFESVYAMVPATMSLLLALFPAILMALAIVREKELGSITNLYVTPVTRIEFLLGKQLPYIGVATANFALMFLMALFLFRLPLKGSFVALSAGRVALRHDDHGVRHDDFRLHPDADRRPVRDRDPDGFAGDTIRRDAGAGVGACPAPPRSWAAPFR